MMPKTQIQMSPEAVSKINEILSRGNSVEIKSRKDDIIILEVKRKLSFSFPSLI